MSYLLSGLMFLIALPVGLAKKTFGSSALENGETVKWKILHIALIGASLWGSMKILHIVVSWYKMSL